MQTKTSLSYWFPLIEAAGLPVPKTIIMKMPEEAKKDVWSMFDGKKPGLAVEAFAIEMMEKAKPFGFPFFLRTDETSGKHNWENTCFVQHPEKLLSHIYKIAEFSECADMLGLPWDTWVLREMLPTLPFGICPRYASMPICREFRFFVENEKVVCVHPYWPLESLQEGGAEKIDYEALCSMPKNADLYALASRAGMAVGGKWSVDILETSRGWFVTDMAEAGKSYHWPSCEHQAFAKG